MHVVIIRTLVERDIDLATVLFPVSYKMVISLTGNYNYTFTNDFKFLPGSELIIGQGANVMVNSDSSLIFYDDFKDENGKDYSSEINLISTNTTISNSLKIPFYPTKYQNTAAVCKVSGTLRVEGEIAGRIIPESDSARLDLSNAKNLTITAKEVNGGFKETSGTSETVYYEVQKANGLAYSSEGSEIRLLENKVYGAFSTETGYAFRERKDSIVLSYNSGGGSSVSDAVYNNVWLDVGVTLSGSNLPSITKKYYTFEGWYLDSGFETSANGHTVYENTQIYAKWSADTYYTEYLFVFEGFTPEVIPTLPENIAFTADTAAIMMPAVPESGYIFNGWYKDADCNHRILTSISGKELLDSGGKIYGQWVALQYTVTYADDKYGDVPYSGGVGNFTPTQLIDQRLPEVKSYERDATKEYYFIGWEYNGVLYENYSFIDLSDTEKLDYTITAKWAKKYALSVEGSSGGNTAVSFTESTVFLYDNKQIAEYFDSYTKKAKQYDDDITVNKYFSGWNNSYTSLTTDSFGESKALTLKANWANKKSHTITVTVTSSKLSSASWSVTALTQNGETYTKDIASDSGTATKTTSVTLYFVTSLEVSITAAGQGKANGWTGYYKAKVTVGKNTTTETAILSGSLGPATRTDKITLADGGTTSVKITT